MLTVYAEEKIALVGIFETCFIQFWRNETITIFVNSNLSFSISQEKTLVRQSVLNKDACLTIIIV